MLPFLFEYLRELFRIASGSDAVAEIFGKECEEPRITRKDAHEHRPHPLIGRGKPRAPERAVILWKTRFIEDFFHVIVKRHIRISLFMLSIANSLSNKKSRMTRDFSSFVFSLPLAPLRGTSGFLETRLLAFDGAGITGEHPMDTE